MQKSQLLRRLFISFGALFILWFVFCLPKELFEQPKSTVIFDKRGQLLNAQVADDGQWRFSSTTQIPDKYIQSLLIFEDKRFYNHPGFDIISFSRAIFQNIKNQRIVSGGSTITMQTIRLGLKNPKRTVFQKVYEIFLALRMECSYSKPEILQLYANNAPFGGNVVGLSAACWRYYNRPPDMLTWAEAATLAVLPNTPSLIHPGRSRSQLKEKRDRLLKKMYKKGLFDETTFELSIAESIPQKPFPLPQLAPHFSHFVKHKTDESLINSTIDKNIQQQTARILSLHNQKQSSNLVFNTAAMIANIHTGEIISYQGNVCPQNKRYSPDVDIIQSKRSSGSILKPFLYALAIDEGIVSPTELVSDIPIYINGFTPENASQDYDGVVPVNEALSKSLNIPFVLLLKKYGLAKFLQKLNDIGFTSFDKNADYYGLSLILGGGEVKLYDLVQQYTNMARIMHNYPNRSSKYSQRDIIPLKLIQKPITDPSFPDVINPITFSAGASFHTIEAMKKVVRPEQEGTWTHFSSGFDVAWKTGTSYGGRDAWAMGVSSDYVIGVWVGNADGEGRAGLSGIQAAGPILFDLFNILKRKTNKLNIPHDDLVEMPICLFSGLKARKICPKIDTVLSINSKNEIELCNRHETVFIDPLTNKRVHSGCFSVQDMMPKVVAKLTPLERYFYKNNIGNTPAWLEGCSIENTAELEFLFPKNGMDIILPKDVGGYKQGVLFKVETNRANKILYWHLNGFYIGKTEGVHHFEHHIERGKYVVSVIDEEGNSIQSRFTVSE